jgi:signal transduction histidine kinase
MLVQESVPPRYDRDLTAVVAHGASLAPSWIDWQRIRAQLQAEIVRRESLETQLQQLQARQSMDVWAGSLAHEIKNPLTSIRTFVQLMSLKRHDYHFVEKFERIVLQELDRINVLVNDLLHLAKPLCLQRAFVPLPTLMHRVVEVYSERLRLQNVVLHTAFAPTLQPLYVDAEQLHRAFTNIVLNAIEAMPAGGVLHIAGRDLAAGQAGTTADDGGVAVTFSDTGGGMSSEQLRTLFTPFQTTKPAGTGLGLALTHKIITAHGGSIRVTSGLDHGTAVTVTLPATPADHPATAQIP